VTAISIANTTGTDKFYYDTQNARWFLSASNQGQSFEFRQDGRLYAPVGINSPGYQTATNCKGNGTAANPSVVTCAAAAAGMFSCDPAASTGTCQVNTTAVTANSEIQIIQDAADGGASQLNVTCNTALVTPAAKPILLSKNAGVSFTINLGTVTANPGCFEYTITN